jgi:poly(A) polymerase
MIQSSAEQIVRRLQEAGFTAYYAGGCVRDDLLKRPCQDIDIATSATPDEVQNLFKRVSDLQGKSFGVLRVHEGNDIFEVTTFRKDGVYQDGRHPESVTFSTPQDDAQRRDFTVNGLFFDPVKKEVIDFVEGQKDLEKKILRAIGNPQKRFEEDYLRILRGLRFAVQLGFEIEAETFKVMTSLAPKVKEIATERVRDELIKGFTSKQPRRFLELLDQSGVLEIVLPEMLKLKGVEQPPEFHPEGDVWKHVCLMLDLAGENPRFNVVFAILFHDISKPETFAIDPTGRIRFNEHEIKGAYKTVGIMRRLKFSNEQIDAVKELVARHMMFKDAPKMRQSTLKRFMGVPNFEDDMELHRIDCSGSHGLLDLYKFIREKQSEFSNEPIIPAPFVTGHDVMELGIKPGPQVGEILTKIQDEQLEGKIKSREEALDLLKRLV